MSLTRCRALRGVPRKGDPPAVGALRRPGPSRLSWSAHCLNRTYAGGQVIQGTARVRCFHEHGHRFIFSSKASPIAGRQLSGGNALFKKRRVTRRGQAVQTSQLERLPFSLVSDRGLGTVVAWDGPDFQKPRLVGLHFSWSQVNWTVGHPRLPGKLPAVCRVLLATAAGLTRP